MHAFVYLLISILPAISLISIILVALFHKLVVIMDIQFVYC